MSRLAHIQALVGCAEIDIKLAIVITDGRSPRATSIMLVGVPSRLVETAVDLTDVSPVEHIVRLQHLHAQEMEVRSHHIVFVTHPYHVGVGKISIEHRVDVGAVALITPGQRDLLCTHHDTDGEKC